MCVKEEFDYWTTDSDFLTTSLGYVHMYAKTFTFHFECGFNELYNQYCS